MCLNSLHDHRGVNMRARPRRQRGAVAMLAVLGLVAALAGCSAEEPEAEALPQASVALPDETTQQLQDAVAHAMAATGASGAVVGVWAPWSGSWVAGVGTQSPGGGDEVSVDSHFRAARVTRAMICDVLYAVVAEGKVELDASVSSLVSGAPDAADVTLEQLCNGTSGIGSYAAQLTPLWMSNPARVWDPRELATYGLGQPRTSAPGTAYRDSDAGYVLLGLALERATGQSAAALIKRYVTDPLGLQSTYLPAAKSAPPADAGPVLTGYQSMPGEGGALDCAAPRDYTELSSSLAYTDGGVVSTITDLGRYAQALAAGELLQDGVDRFDTPLPAYADAPAWYTATGGAIQAGSLIGQYGGVPGYLSAAFSDPTTGLTVALVLNNSAGSTGIASALAWELAAIASKAPATSGETAPEAGLPWTPQQQHDAITQAAVCPLPTP